MSLTAGLIGLLHDIGHSPYSHTLEDALEYSDSDHKYDHEKIGCQIIDKVFKEYFATHTYFMKALKVLNKTIGLEELSGLEKLLRSIIDGYFDVDKGDYLLRDSYHCGVTYGIYDYQRLWNNVVITDNNVIGVKDKAAIELWKLRFGRFSMFKNVYKHHTRNITDALLVEIIQNAIEKNVDKVIPFNIIESITEDEIKKFELWTDTELIRDMLSLDDEQISKLVNYFIERKLYKRFLLIELDSNEVKDTTNGKELKSYLQNIFDEIKRDVNYKHISYLIEEDTPAPVQEKGISEENLFPYQNILGLLLRIHLKRKSIFCIFLLNHLMILNIDGKRYMKCFVVKFLKVVYCLFGMTILNKIILSFYSFSKIISKTSSLYHPFHNRYVRDTK